MGELVCPGENFLSARQDERRPRPTHRSSSEEGCREPHGSAACHCSAEKPIEKHDFDVGDEIAIAKTETASPTCSVKTALSV